MRSAIIAILVFTSLSSHAQSVTQILQLLKTKDFTALKHCIDSASDVNHKTLNGVYARWEQLRDITPVYQEGWFSLSERTPVKGKPGVSTEDFRMVYLITSGSEIIRYLVRQRQSKKADEEWAEFYPVIDSFTNETAFRDFEKSFRQLYNAKLNQAELFTAPVYGLRCGYSPMYPDKREELNGILRKRNTKALNAWLRSPNAELQTYAVEGFYQLKQKGFYQLTAEEKRIITLIKNKNGTISTCSGCIYGNRTIKEVLSEFVF